MTIKNRGGAFALAVALAGSACAEVDVAEPQAAELGARTQALSFASETESAISSVTEDPNARSGDWPSGSHDWANTGHNPAETRIGRHNVAQLAPVWQHTYDPRGDASEPVPVIATTVTADGIAYIVDMGGWVHARRLEDGALLWRSWVTQALPEPIFRAVVQGSPVVTDDALFVGDSTAAVTKVDRHTGAVLWTTDVDANPQALIQGNLATTNEYVLFGVSSFEADVSDDSDLTMRGSVVALDRNTGALKWQLFTTSDQTLASPRFGAGVGVWSSPAVDVSSGRLFIGTGQHYEPGASGPCSDDASCESHANDLDLSDSLLSIDIESGALLDRRQFTVGDVFGKRFPEGYDFDVGAPPNLFTIQRDGTTRDVIGVGDKEGTYYVLDRHTLEIVWSKRISQGSVLGGIQSAAAYADGVVYVAAHERADGTSLNTAIPPGQAAIFMTTLDGFYTLQGGSRTRIMALDAATGDVVWETTTGTAATFAPVIVANGLLFHGDANGALRAFHTDTGELMWQTQMGGFPVEGGYLAGNLITGLSISHGRLLVSSMPLMTGVPIGVTAFGAPECVPNCAGRECGDDGCGGTCGSCDEGDLCSAEGQCKSQACSAPAFSYSENYSPGAVVTATCETPFVGTSCYENLGATFAWRCDYPVWCWLRPGSIDLGWWSVWTPIERCD